MPKLPGNSTGKFRSTKTLEELSIEVTSTIVLAKKSLTRYKLKIEKLREEQSKVPYKSEEWLKIENLIEMLIYYVEVTENMLDQIGTFQDNLAVLLENYNPNDDYYNELKVTINYIPPLLYAIKELLEQNKENLKIQENKRINNNAMLKGDSLRAYEGYFTYEGHKFQYRMGIRKEPFQDENESRPRQARVVFGIKDAISSNTEDVLTLRMDNNDRVPGRSKDDNRLEMDFTFPKSEEITDKNTGNKKLKEKINSEIYGNTSQTFSYHLTIKENSKPKMFRNYAMLVENVYLK